MSRKSWIRHWVGKLIFFILIYIQMFDVNQKKPLFILLHCYICSNAKFLLTDPQYKNANIAVFVLAVPSEMNQTNEVCNLKI